MDPKNEKRCSKCRVLKRKSEFTKRPDRACRTRSRCKKCERSRYTSWRNKNVLRARNYSKSYYRRKGKKRLTELRKASVSYRVLDNLRRRINKTVRSGSKSARTEELLGCSIPDFKIYLESKFEPDMCWDNYGSRWHIDHIIPCSLFDLTKPDHQRRCFHFSNLQPLFAEVNLRKHNKYIIRQTLWSKPWIEGTK